MRRCLRWTCLLFVLGCSPTPSEPQQQQQTAKVEAIEPEPAVAEPEPEVETPKPEPELSQPEPEAPPPLPEGVELTHGFVIQVASKKQRDDAKAIATQLETRLANDLRAKIEDDGAPALAVFAKDSHAFSIRTGRLWRVMVDGLPNYEAAEAVLPWVEDYVGEGGLVRDLTKVCPGRRLLEPGVYACVEDIPRPDLESPPTAAAPIPDQAAPVRPDPPAIQHPPAERVLVVLADDRKSSYRTLVWQRAAGSLPTTGLAPASLVEEVPGLLTSDGAAIWELVIEAEPVEYPKCDCEAVSEERDDIIGRGVVNKSFNRLVARPRGGGQARTLIAATDFHVESTDACLSHAGELERNWQIIALAGPHVLYVDKVFDEGICGMVQQWTIMDLKIASLSGHTDLATLERELPFASVEQLRRKASRVLADEVVTDEIGVPEDELTPAALLLNAIYPSYRSGKRFGVELQYSVQSCHLCGDGTWTDGHYTARSKTDHVPSSLLSPPEDVRALLEYAWREYSKLTPIGWSRQIG